MFDPVRLTIVAALLAASAGAGWTTAVWRKNAEIAVLQAQQANAIAVANSAALALQQERDIASNALAKRLMDIDMTGVTALKKAQNETDRLRTCVRDGTCGLRIAAVCQGTAIGSVVPSTPADTRVDSGAGARLTLEAEQDYFDFRADIRRVQAKLTACQSAAATLTGQKNQ